VGTKFTWPDYGPSFKDVYLNREKQALWKKWIGIYNSLMLSTGTFRDLYVYGYDEPEGYAIEKGEKMYYAFFSPDPAKAWKSGVELRGLSKGRYRVVDYVNGKALGTIEGPNARVDADFTGRLLLEASRIP